MRKINDKAVGIALHTTMAIVWILGVLFVMGMMAGALLGVLPV